MAEVAVERPHVGADERPTPGWFATTFESLHNRHYRTLWLGTAFAFFAFQMSMTAQGVVAFDLTGNNRTVGLVMFGQGIAMLCLNPFGGAIADRVSKRVLLFIAQGVIGATFLGVGVLLALDQLTVFWLAALAFTGGMMFSFLGPSRTAYIGDLVGPERRGNALALMQVAMNGTRIAGPVLAGGMLAFEPIGAAGTYLAMGSLFIIVVASLLFLPPSMGHKAAGSSVLGDIALGVRHVRENRRLFQIVFGFVLVTMVGFPHMVVLPAFSKEVLGAGDAGFGLLVGVAAIGGLVASLFVASLADSSKAYTILTVSGMLMGVALIGTGLAPTYALALLAMLFVGAGASGYQTLNNALAMKESNSAYLGRVMSLMMLAWSFMSLISLPMGVLADIFGERAMIAAMGAGVCVVMALLRVWQLRLDRQELALAEAGA